MTMKTKEEALHRAAALCTMAEKCEADIRTKLRDWGIAEKDADDIVQRLKEGKYLDEERYCHAFVNDKLRFNGWGRIKITYTLRQKGIADSLIDDALAHIDEDAYTRMLTELLQTKLRSVKGKTSEERIGKLVRFAQSRGFELSLAITIAKKLVR